LKVTYSVAGKTDRGLVREGNEDAFKVDRERDLFLVCDGMGGHQAGEVASNEACDVISLSFSVLYDQILSREELYISDGLPPKGDLLIRALRIANRSIYIRSRSDSAYSGMGTTAVAAVIDNNLIGIAHVGDSRAYRLINDNLVPLTADHSWVSELQASGQITEADASKMVARNVITRALGVNEKVEVDFRADPILPGGIYILCSDGLCGYAKDDEIKSVAVECAGNVEKIAENLVQLANDHGGQDNVTVVAVRIDSVEEIEDAESFGPVTISKENDEAIVVENEYVKSITELRETSQETAPPESARPGKLPTILIFLAFVIIAAIIIYLYTGK
jgi:protein phosphatase